MRLEDGLWYCSYCGEVIDLPPDAVPEVVITAASGKPTYRIFSYQGVEVHRCELVYR